MPTCKPTPRPCADLRSTSAAAARILCTAALAGLTGCGVAPNPIASPIVAHAAVHGRVMGGQQPVAGATIQLYQVGTAGNASASATLGTSTTTDSGGGFDITGDYTCPSPTTQVYLVSTQGNPGLSPGTNNAVLTMVTTLGDCINLATIPFIQVSEITTVASAWALAPFASGYASIGAAPNNASGIRNAMITAMALADNTSNAVPSPLLPGNATMETAKLISLADLIGSCVNSDGTTACTQLFFDANDGSGSADSFQVALQIVQNPGFHVGTLFADIPAQAAFGGGLGAAPNDWTMSITYTGGGLNMPQPIAIDSTGTIWVGNTNANVISPFSPQGVPLYPTGYADQSFDLELSMAIDSSGNIFVANGTDNGSLNGGGGTISKVSVTSGAISGVNFYTPPGMFGPSSVALDPNTNDLWITSANSNFLSEISDAGADLTGGSGYMNPGTGAGIYVALDDSGSPYVINAPSDTILGYTASGVQSNIWVVGLQTAALAFDIEGNFWATDTSNSQLVFLGPAGAVYNNTLTGGGLNQPGAIVADAGDHLWIVNQGVPTFSEFSGTNDSEPYAPGTVFSPTTGFGLDAAMSAPDDAAVDASGNLWITDNFLNTLVAFVGIAVPTETPVLGLPLPAGTSYGGCAVHPHDNTRPAPAQAGRLRPRC